jgi:integrase
VRSIHRLTAVKVARLRMPGRYADGGGLYLQVSKWNTRSWLFRFERNGKERQMGLGSAGVLSLTDARTKAHEARRTLLDGLDPIETRNTTKTAQRVAAAKGVTFEECAEAFMRAHAPGWKNPKHRDQWRSTLKTYAYPEFGKMPVAAVDTVPVKHRPALPYAELPSFISDLRGCEFISARALEFLILTAARTDEVISARAQEIDVKAKMWVVPPERTKSGREHRVPLCDRALDLILPAIDTGNGLAFLFPTPRSKKSMPLSNMAMLELLRELRPGFTVHGFRSTFKDWASETTMHENIVSEMALAHKVPDEVEAAYRRGDLLQKRFALMNDWECFCSVSAAVTVVSIKRRRSRA